MGCCNSVHEDLLSNLALSPFFCLPTARLLPLANLFSIREYNANQLLWYSNNKSDTKYIKSHKKSSLSLASSSPPTETSFNIIISGEVQLEFFDDNKETNKQQIVVIYKKSGQCFGFDALSSTTDTSKSTSTQYNCIAVTDLTVYQLTRSNLNTFWSNNNQLHTTFINSKITPITSYLKQINVFETITAHGALMLASMFRWRNINRNDILFEEGSIGEEFYVVAKGCVAVVVEVIEEDHEDVEDHNLHIIENRDQENEGKKNNIHFRHKSENSGKNNIMIGGPQLNFNTGMIVDECMCLNCAFFSKTFSYLFVFVFFICR